MRDRLDTAWHRYSQKRSPTRASEPWRAGPVARAEIMDNIGLNVGWMFDDDDDDDGEGFYASVDYFFKLFEDLNLTPGL